MRISKQLILNLFINLGTIYVFIFSYPGAWYLFKSILLFYMSIKTNLDSVFKSRDINLSTKFHIVKAMIFPVVIYGCESWTINKTFELWCWRRLLRLLWTARRSNHSILREINPEYLLEGLMLKQGSSTLATWCEELTHWKTPWCWERLREGGEGGDRGWDGWMASLIQETWVWANSRRWWRTGKPDVLQFMGLQIVIYDWAPEQQQGMNR